jgi:(p)ppGpp synthase/HD superfamily hydrolase
MCPGQAWFTRPVDDVEAAAQRWSRVLAAVEMAFALHAGQVRKQGGTPYVGHLFGVASLVLDDGGDEDQVIAALLHDAAEDHGGRRTLTEISRRFGPRVAAIVDACSDTFESPKPPWPARKQAWLDRLRTVPDDAVRVIAADKLHNARDVVAALRAAGPPTLDVFTGGRDGTLWYYREAAARLAERAPGPLVAELDRTVAEMHRLAPAPQPDAPSAGR